MPGSLGWQLRYAPAAVRAQHAMLLEPVSYAYLEQSIY